MSQIRKNILVTLASSNANMVISFAASIVLARLLSPAEIGVFSVAFAFAGLFRTVREMGIGAYIVQEPELTPQRFRSAFGVSLIVSLVTCVAVAVAAPFAGQFYRDEGVTMVLYVLAANLMLSPFGSTSLALLRRDLKFTEIAIAETFATVVQNVAAIAFAMMGMGYMSLAWSGLAGVLASVASGVFYRPGKTPWLPGIAEWRRVLEFCGFTSASSLVGYANNTASDLILGRMLNVEAVALFSRALSLAGMVGPVIFRAVNTLSLPYFTEARRQGKPLGDVMDRSIAALGAMCLPLYTVLAIMADPLILLLYGPTWQGVAPILQILCLNAIVWTPSALTSQMLTAMGEVKRLFRLEIYSLVLKVAVVVPAALYGLQAVAWAYVVATAVSSVLRLHAVARAAGTQLHAPWMFVVPAIYPTVLACIGPLAMMPTHLAPYMVVPVSLLLATVGWLAGVLLTRSELRDELVALLKKFKRAP